MGLQQLLYFVLGIQLTSSGRRCGFDLGASMYRDKRPLGPFAHRYVPRFVVTYELFLGAFNFIFSTDHCKTHSCVCSYSKTLDPPDDHKPAL